MRGLILILALWPAAASAQSLDDAVTGGYSAVASRYQWGSTGGDWPVPPEAPAPIVDCRGDFRSGSCGPTTFVASGTPGLASTYWRPGGGATAGSGVAFDGVDDFFDAGDVGDQTGDFTLCVPFRADSSTAAYIVAKDANPAGRSFTLYKGGTNAIVAYVHAADGSTSSITLGTVSLGVESLACLAYDFVANGSSILRGNLNGVAPSELTTAVGPPQNTASPLRIGAFSGATPGGFFAGTISRVTLWSGWAASAADLARMVRSQYAAQGSMGEPLTVTRASSKSCSIGGTWFTVPSGQPCIGDAGLSVEGSRTNSAINSEALNSWTLGNSASPLIAAPVVTADQAADPNGKLTADQIAFPAVSGAGAYSLVYLNLASMPAATYTGSIHLRAAAPATVYLSTMNSTAAYATTACAVGTSWTRCETPSQTQAGAATRYIQLGVDLRDASQSAKAAQTIFAWGGQLENGAGASSYIPTTTTPVTRAADVVSAANGIADGGRWCVRWVGMPGVIPSGATYNGLWTLGVAYGANSASLYLVSNTLVFGVWDAAGAVKSAALNAAAAGVSAGVPVQITACTNGGILSVSINGTSRSATAGGTGTGIMGTIPGSLTFGRSAAAQELDGFISSLTTCNTAVPEECQ